MQHDNTETSKKLPTYKRSHSLPRTIDAVITPKVEILSKVGPFVLNPWGTVQKHRGLEQLIDNMQLIHVIFVMLSLHCHHTKNPFFHTNIPGVGKDGIILCLLCCIPRKLSCFPTFVQGWVDFYIAIGRPFTCKCMRPILCQAIPARKCPSSRSYIVGILLETEFTLLSIRNT